MIQSWGSKKQTAIQPGEPARPRDLRGGTETILLVESDPHLRRLMSLALVRHGYQILPATDSTAALHAWSEHPRQIHLLFTGIKFPSGSSGVDLAAQLRVCQRGLKVLFMSADPADLATIQSAGQPSQNFLLKPVSLSELLETIRKTLDSCD
jgi:DNA-binding response OmpR family regulator